MYLYILHLFLEHLKRHRKGTQILLRLILICYSFSFLSPFFLFILLLFIKLVSLLLLYLFLVHQLLLSLEREVEPEVIALRHDRLRHDEQQQSQNVSRFSHIFLISLEMKKQCYSYTLGILNSELPSPSALSL